MPVLYVRRIDELLPIHCKDDAANAKVRLMPLAAKTLIQEPRYTRRSVTPREWDEFAATVSWASPQHRSAWGEALASIFSFIATDYVLILADGRAVAGIPLMRFSVGGVMRSIQSSAFGSAGGPLIADDFIRSDSLYREIFDTIDDHARRERAFEASIILPPTAPQALAEHFIAAEGAAAARRNCPLLSLDKSMDEIRGGYEASVRRAVRKAQKEGVEVVAEASLALVEQSFAIYRATMERIGGTVKPWPFVRKLLESGLATAFVARHGGAPVGLVIMLATERMAIYWISASDMAASQLRPTNALVDHAIEWCHRRGIGIFSFGESPGERSSLEQFKLGWGSQIASTVEWTRVYRPLLKRSWEAIEPIARRSYKLIKGARSRAKTGA
jgi:CelD/BcsL family acetyltransferase involved in cellulose biosynthesis